MAEKGMKNEVKIADQHKEIEELKAKNKALYDDCCDLQKQNDLLVKESVDAENRYSEERKRRIEAEKACCTLDDRIKFLSNGIEVTKKQIAFEKKTRIASIPKLVTAGAVALVMLFIGGLAAYTVVWDLGDLGIALMTVFNMIAILPMSGEAVAALKEYTEMRKKEKSK